MAKDEVHSDKKKKSLSGQRWMQAFKDGSMALIATKACFTTYDVFIFLKKTLHNELMQLTEENSQDLVS